MADEDQTEEGKVGRDWVKGTDPKSSWLTRWLKRANGWQRIWFVLNCFALTLALVMSLLWLHLEWGRWNEPVTLPSLWGTTVLGSGLLYLLGWTIGWIIKGFRPKGSKE